MPPRNVALVIGQLQLGGAERQLYELAIRLDRTRFDPLVVCLSGVTEPFAGRLESRGIPVEVIPRAGHFEIGRVRALAGILRRREIDLAHSFLLAANAYVYASRCYLALTGRRRPRFIASSRVCSPAVGAGTMALHRRAFRAASAVIANSRIVGDHTRRMYGLSEGRIRVIHNGLPLEDYSPPPGDPRGEEPIRSAARRELEVPEGAILVGTLARLSPQKNLDLFLDLAERLAPRPADAAAVRFVLVGTGPSEGELKARASARGLDDRVRFAGARQDVYRVLTAIDIFVLTSRFEGLPNAIMEAMAAGRPVVATRSGGTEELVTDGETGYLVAGDTAELADRVSRLASDAGLRAAMGRRGRARIETSFAVETMVFRTMSLYDEVLG